MLCFLVENGGLFTGNKIGSILRTDDASIAFHCELYFTSRSLLESLDDRYAEFLYDGSLLLDHAPIIDGDSLEICV